MTTPERVAEIRAQRACALRIGGGEMPSEIAIDDLLSSLTAAESARDAAYAALRGCVHALGNGSGIGEAASVEFHLLAPQEVAMCVERITKERDAARADALAASNHYMRIAAVRDAQAEALRVVEAERDALVHLVSAHPPFDPASENVAGFIVRVKESRR